MCPRTTRDVAGLTRREKAKTSELGGAQTDLERGRLWLSALSSRAEGAGTGLAIKMILPGASVPVPSSARSAPPATADTEAGRTDQSPASRLCFG